MTAEIFTETENPPQSLSACDSEPIHTPGQIQPFGAMVACPISLGEITYCSGNVASFLETQPEMLLGAAFDSVFGKELTHGLRNLVSVSTARNQRERAGLYDLPQGTFEIFVHVNKDDLAIVEFEPPPSINPNAVQTPLDKMRKYLAAANERDSILGLLKVCVAGLSDLSGFDRVMAYQYLPNGDGEIVAEVRSPGVNSFLGLRFPSWDVPTQARALQIKNPLRILIDVDQVPIPILTIAQGQPPIDLSLAHTRGISKIHTEYLTNMGVQATMTIGIVVDGNLWGMFACHHMSAKTVGCDVRIACELFGQMISLIIKQKIEFEKTLKRQKAAIARENLLAEVDMQRDILECFPALVPLMNDILVSDGLALIHEGKIERAGNTPSEEIIHRLAKIDTSQDTLIKGIDNLSEFSQTENDTLDGCAGALILRATEAQSSELVFFRNEKVSQLNWAGRPEKTLEPGPLGPRISPRGSFDAYVESQTGFCDQWDAADIASAKEIQGLLTQFIVRGEKFSLIRQKEVIVHQRQQDLMIVELNHRVKNILALIRSLSRRTKETSDSLESYAMSLEQRITALSEAHDLAVSHAIQGVSIRGVLEAQLSPFLSRGRSQARLAGPLVGLRADIAPMVSLVLHEIISNAAKYGALSNDTGSIDIKWELSNGGLCFSWEEKDGPAFEPPTRRGFGRSLIEKAIPFELDGSADLNGYD